MKAQISTTKSNHIRKQNIIQSKCFLQTDHLLQLRTHSWNLHVLCWLMQGVCFILARASESRVRSFCSTDCTVSHRETVLGRTVRVGEDDGPGKITKKRKESLSNHKWVINVYSAVYVHHYTFFSLHVNLVNTLGTPMCY